MYMMGYPSLFKGSRGKFSTTISWVQASYTPMNKQSCPLLKKIIGLLGSSIQLMFLEDVINFFINTDEGNDLWWFFTFSNRNNGAIKNMLVGKQMHVKK